MWTEIAAATLHGDSGAARALESFYQQYRQPVRQFIVMKGFSDSDAEDLLHEFFLELLRDSTLRKADRTRGKFRSFLLGAAARFLHDERVRRRAQKRGGGVAADPIEDHLADPALLTRTDETEFDRAWALNLVESAFYQVESEFAKKGLQDRFRILKRFLPGGGSPATYHDGAAEMGVSEAYIKVEIHRLRSRFRELLRQRVLATVSRPHELDEEMRYLAQVLRAGSSPRPEVNAYGLHADS
jgi:RNA polymerase sigma-70 factor (ECF subfamily)